MLIKCRRYLKAFYHRLKYGIAKTRAKIKEKEFKIKDLKELKFLFIGYDYKYWYKMRGICKKCRKLTKSGELIIDIDGKPICKKCFHEEEEK